MDTTEPTQNIYDTFIKKNSSTNKIKRKKNKSNKSTTKKINIPTYITDFNNNNNTNNNNTNIPFPCHPIDSLILENKSNEETKTKILGKIDTFFLIFNEDNKDNKYNYPRRNDVEINEDDKNKLNQLESKYTNTRPTNINEDKDLYCQYFDGYDCEAGGKRRSTRRKRRKRKYTRKRR